MGEHAIHIKGIDESTREHVRIHLRVVTSEESNTAAIRFGAPCGFLPEVSGREVAGRRAADISSCQAQVFGSARGAESPGLPRVFAAPLGFLPES